MCFQLSIQGRKWLEVEYLGNMNVSIDLTTLWINTVAKLFLETKSALRQWSRSFTNNAG